MKELMMNEDYSDVTLVSEDKMHIKANVSVLSACSPVFKNILRAVKNSSPIIYLRGIQYCEMESIMQFIYLGEATFYEERMDEFLAVAKSLEIKELSNAETEPEDVPDVEPTHPDDETLHPGVVEEQTIKSNQINAQAKNGFAADNNYECKQCHKTYSGSGALSKHNQSVHQGVKYSCDHCEHQCTQKSDLTRHIQAKHEGVKYPCDHCEYQATQQSSLKIHIQSKHEGIKYACDQCDFQAKTQSHLTVHIKVKHEGVKYACNHCDYQATQRSYLKIHIQSKHEGVKHACGQCDFQATTKQYLTVHVKSQHNAVKYAE